MKIEHLIWSQVVVKDESTGEVIQSLPNVSARFNKDDLIWFREYTSVQGVNTGKNLSYSHPELLSMNAQGITLKAFQWGRTTKDKAVILELEF